VEIGKSYPFFLNTHCGIRQAYFKGQWWIADPIIGISPPDDWAPDDPKGTMTLVEENLAMFTTKSGRSYKFIPWPSPVICY